jgi:hypothetical protein
LVTSESFGKGITQQHRKLLVNSELGTGAAKGKYHGSITDAGNATRRLGRYQV